MARSTRSPDAPPAEQPSEWFADGLAFTCTQCGNCCTGPPGYVWFNDEEAANMAAFLGISERQFRRKFAHRVNGHWTLNERRNGPLYDCVFLDRDEQGKALCRVYSVRPHQCRTWPFWPENLESPEAFADLAKGCPGVKAGLEGRGKVYDYQQIRIVRDSHEHA